MHQATMRHFLYLTELDATIWTSYSQHIRMTLSCKYHILDMWMCPFLKCDICNGILPHCALLYAKKRSRMVKDKKFKRPEPLGQTNILLKKKKKSTISQFLNVFIDMRNVINTRDTEVNHCYICDPVCKNPANVFFFVIHFFST